MKKNDFSKGQKKIGIITMSSGENYGNKLQNFALQQVIKKIGFLPETINNITTQGFDDKYSKLKFIKKINFNYIIKALKIRVNNKLYIKNDRDTFIKSLIWCFKNKNKIVHAKIQRRMNFMSFINSKIIQSDFEVSVGNSGSTKLEKFNYFICGSDQIWNPFYPQNSMIDFLCFAPKHKRISYAPSFGVSYIPNYRKTIYKKWISEIPNLSIREEKGAKIIKELTGRDAKVLVDPTLLLSKEEWISISKPFARKNKNKYILTYFLGNQTVEYEMYILNLAKAYCYDIINLLEIREFENYAVGPEEFIDLVNNSELVCTDSFHGLVFSIIMKTDFIIFDRKEGSLSMRSRQENLLKMLNMESRRFENSSLRINPFNTNFERTNDIIEFEQNKSLQFLKEATENLRN